MSNQEMKKLLKEEHIYMWEVEATFSKWFREELTEEKQQQVLSAIEAIKLDRLDTK